MALSQLKNSKKKQKNLRNVLGLNEKTILPVASERECLALNSKLKSCLKVVKIDIPRAPWSTTSLLSKEERKKANEELLKSQAHEKIEAYHYALKLRQFLFLGINSLCKGIEKEEVASCLLDADITPKVLVTHAMELAKNSNVPTLTISNLKGTLKSILGFSSMAIGFQKEVLKDKEHIFYDISSYIIEISKSTETSNKNLVKDLNISTKHLSVNKKIIEPPPNLDIPSLLKDIYLLRESKDIRVFKPPPASENTPSLLTTDQLMPEEDATIKLPSFSIDLTEQVSTTRYFKPLIVNRIQSNPKKKKNKFKKKKAK